MDHVRVHPKFLHSNATSHKWALGAFAELLDNSLDEVFYGSTFVNVDMLENKKDGSRMLVIEGTPTDSGPTTTPLPDKKLLAFILDRLQKKDIFVVCGSKNCFSSVWRWDLKAMSCFYLGRLEDTLTLVEKLEQIDYSSQKFQGTTPESLGAFAATVRGLLCHRAEGIKAFKSGRHSEAVEHYNSALACTSCSRPFAAICLYDRSASHQALGRTREAIKDCKKAAEMDPSSRDIQIRAAGCHLALGELEEALKYYKCLLQQDSDKCLESDQVIEASKGLQKAQVLDDCPGDLSFWYRHISKGAWPFSTADHGWPISDCTSEGLKSWEKTVDCYSPGKGLMPASFKVRTVPLDGDNGAFEEHLSKL